MKPGDVPIETSSIYSGDFITCYRSAGHGDPLILLHGAGGNSSMFEGALARLAEHRQVIAPDILGHGRSSGPAGCYTASAYCRWLDSTLSGLETGPVDLAGHSMGGAIALRFAARRPALVRHLILIDPISLGLPDIRSTLRLLAALFSTKPEQALNLVAQVMFSSNGPPSEGSNAWTQLRSAEIPRGLSGFGWMFARTWHVALPVSRRRLARFEMPILILWGQDDRYFPVVQARRALHFLRSARLVEIPAAGHVPFLEQPGPFAAAIDAFLRSG